MTHAFKFLGTDDTVHVCDCCGRKDLKATVALEVEGDIVRYGSQCAAKALRIPAKDVRKGTKAADDAKWAAENAAREARHAAHMAAWKAHLNSKCPQHRDDIGAQILTLGGYTAAREGFSV